MRRREEDNFRRLQLESDQRRNIGYGAAARSDARVERRRHNDRFRQFQSAHEEERRLEELAKERILRQQMQEAENRLASALADKNRETICREKTVQKIRSESHELRDLESRLKNAYLNLQREEQVSDRIAMDQRRQESEREHLAMLKREAEEEERRAREEELLRIQKNQEVGQFVRGQIQEKAELEYERREEYLREKELVDQVAERIRQQEERDRIARLNQRLEVKQVMEEQLEQREERERREAMARIAHEEANAQFNAEVERRRVAEIAAKEEAQARRFARIQKQSDELQREMDNKDRTEQLLIDLYQEEQREKDRQMAIADQQKALRLRDELLLSYQEQLRLKKLRQEQEDKETESFRRMMMEKFAEDERIQRLTRQRRRQKMLEFQDEVRSLVEQRKRMRQLQRERDLLEEQKHRESDARRQEIINQERRSLIQEHVAKILKFLPRGVLTESDLALLPPDVVAEIKKTRDPFEVYRGRRRQRYL